jgi:hypothetical protein
LRTWASLLRVYVASAILNDLGQIVDPLGDVLVESTYEAVATARINLDYRVLHTDFCHDKWDSILARYGSGVTLRWHTREGKFLIASEMADVTVTDLMREFELEDLDAYLARARAHRDAALDRPKPISVGME